MMRDETRARAANTTAATNARAGAERVVMNSICQRYAVHWENTKRGGKMRGRK